MTVYRLRVTVLPISPLFTGEETVWRDIEVGGSHTLRDLHDAIFDAFDRFDAHLYEFVRYNETGLPERTYVDPHSYDGSPSWRPKENNEIERLLEQMAPNDASKEAKEYFRDVHANPPPEGNVAETTIADLELSVDDMMDYLFDYGDNWEHHVEVRETHDGSLDGAPAIVAAHGDSPPQYPHEDDL
jgi:hypothetical protein